MKKLKQISRSQFKALLDLDMPVYALDMDVSEWSKDVILRDLCEDLEWMKFARVAWRGVIDNSTHLKVFFTVVDEDSDE